MAIRRNKEKIGEANRKPKPEGFGKKPEGFKEKISKSWENRIVTWGDKISKGDKGWQYRRRCASEWIR